MGFTSHTKNKSELKRKGFVSYFSLCQCLCVVFSADFAGIILKASSSSDFVFLANGLKYFLNKNFKISH